MEKFKEYGKFDGLGLADLIKKKEVSVQEVSEAAIEKISSVNPELNAVVTIMYNEGKNLIQKGLPEGPFSGVPFLLKDLLAAYAGYPLTGGCKALRDYIPDKDSELVRRFKKAGLVVLGKTNCPEFGLMGITEPALHGPTRNPWNKTLTPGGSSGGSAAAVASGMVPLASAGDGGGSIRIPASYCGLFGLKPSRGRVPTGPDHGQIWQGAVVEHAITRSVRDSAALLDFTQGTDIGAPYIIPSPDIPYLEEMKRSPGKLKIAFSIESPVGTEVDPDCVKAVKETAQLLEKLGNTVEECAPDLDGNSLARSYIMLYFGEVAAEIEEMKGLLGRNIKSDELEVLTQIMALLGRTFSAGDFVKELRYWQKAGRVMGEFHQRFDLFLTPTTASLPVKIGELLPKQAEAFLMKIVKTFRLGKLLKAFGMVDQIAIENFSKTPFTQICNFTGQPAMSVPLYWTEEGIPCGSHFAARFGEEATLFKLAAQLEAERPWFNRRPDI